MKRTGGIAVLLAVLTIWLAFIGHAAAQCEGVLVVRAWPPGWACIEEP